MELYDILITSVPEMENDIPSPAPFYLKGFLQKYGFKVKAIDGNQFKTVEKLKEEIEKYKFRILGISVFSFMNVDFALELGKLFPNSKKLFGGSGVGTPEWNKKFSKTMGDYITAEGEYALLNYIRGNKVYPGINGIPPIQIQDISELPFPDYSDIDVSKYNKISVTGSRGCVRHCSFCNVRDIWKHYRYIKGDKLAESIIQMYKDTGIRKFAFSDSLVNGSPPEFRKMCQYFKEYREKTKNKIIWFGQFIIRKNIKEYEFKLMKEAGCGHLSLGVESGSEKVRKSMNKNFSNEAIYWNILNLVKYKIEFKMLLIIGYPTETENDFEETLKLLQEVSKYTSEVKIAVTPHMFLPFDNKNLKLQGFKWENENSSYIDRLFRYKKTFNILETGGFVIEEHALKKLRIVEKQLRKINENDKDVKYH